VLNKTVFRPKAPRATWCVWCRTERDLDPTKPCAVCNLHGRTYVRPHHSRGPGR
jgi:hypothetical protein